MNVPTFTPFQLWIWWLPSVHGLMATEFRVTIPANAVLSSSVQTLESVTILDEFGINQDGVIAVEPQSWGAIKSFYR